MTTFTIDHYMIASITAFASFDNALRMDGYCSVCLKMLRQNEYRWRYSAVQNNFACTKWYYPVIMNAEGEIIVCNIHLQDTRFDSEGILTFPGLPFDTSDLTFKEKSALSPVKIMTQITRRTNRAESFVGHYQLSGSIWSRSNREFAAMLYSGTIGFTFDTSAASGIQMDRVLEKFMQLSACNPFLRTYLTQDVAQAYLNAQQQQATVVEENNEITNINWPSYVMPIHDVFPSASTVDVFTMSIGTDIVNTDIQYNHIGLFSLMFPHLYTEGKGHYNLSSVSDPNASNTIGTLKQYIKALLQCKDRRFARDPNWIFFMFDLVERLNIQSANRRVVSARRNLTRNEVYTDTFNNNNTSVVPYVIRSSASYKRVHALDLHTVFNYLGPPQLFLTFTCDDFSGVYQNVLDNMHPWTDAPMFTQAFKDRWLHFLNRVIKGRFATIIGGIKEFSWVMEIQDRGSPHIHIVLWTHRSTEELLAIPELIVADIPDASAHPRLFNQVVNKQTHACTAYCMRSAVCRFGFPHRPRNDTIIDADNRVYIKRSPGSEYINQYNPYLLSIWDASMDIQICLDSKVEVYLAKYLSKYDTRVSFTSASVQTPQEHFSGRKVGLVEAVYDLMGYHKHQTTLDVIYIDTTMPHVEQRRQLKPASSLANLNGDSTNIYTRTHLEKYQDRDHALLDLSMMEYFRIYILNFSQQEREVTDDVFAGDFDPRFTTTKDMNVTVRVRIDHHTRRVRKHVRDSKNYIFTARNKIPLARYFNTNPQHGEQFYYQQIILHLPCRNFEALRGDRLWRDWFHTLLETDPEFTARFSQEFLDNVFEQEAILDRQDRQTVPPPAHRLLLDNYLLEATADQRFAFDTITSCPIGVHFIHGGAGVGKSRLLAMLFLNLTTMDFVPIKLAPTGVAANTIEGQTLHRFLGISNPNNAPNLVRVNQYFTDLRADQKLALLIDETSMISSEILTILDTCLRATTLNNALFGDVLVIFFGDFGQLTPIIHLRSDAQHNLPLFHPLFSTARVYPLFTNCRVEAEELLFKRFLNQIRIGVFNDFFFDIVRQRTLPVPPNVLRVYVSNKERNEYNDLQLQHTEGNIVYYNAIDNSGDIPSSLASKETGLIKSLRLKVGVPVMLLHNISVANGWTNGTLATVTSLQAKSVEIERANGNRLIVHPITRTVYKSSVSRSQLPLDLAFSTTVHKVQSLTLPSVAVCLYNDFLSHGQLYVAASRVTKLNDLYFFPNVQNTTLQSKVDLNCIQAIESIEGALSEI